MSIKLMSQVWDFNLPPKEKLLLLLFADYANDQGFNIYPSLATMSARTSIPRRTLVRVVQSLRDRGLLEIEQEATATTPHKYRIPVNSRGAILAPGAILNAQGCQNARKGSATVAPKPLKNHQGTSGAKTDKPKTCPNCRVDLEDSGFCPNCEVVYLETA